MTTELDPFAHWDAAYVLGALDADDRRAYERHLDDCDHCSMAVAAGTRPSSAGTPATSATAIEQWSQSSRCRS